MNIKILGSIVLFAVLSKCIEASYTTRSRRPKRISTTSRLSAAHEISIRCVSFNAGNPSYSVQQDQLRDIIKEMVASKKDILVLGLQEAKAKKKPKRGRSTGKTCADLLHNFGGYRMVIYHELTAMVGSNGIAIFIAVRESSGVEVEVTKFEKKLGGRGYSANKGYVGVKLKATKNGKDSEIIFQNTHNSSNDPKRNKKDFKACMVKYDKTKPYILIGDLNPRLKHKTFKDEWMKNVNVTDKQEQENLIKLRDRVYCEHFGMYDDVNSKNVSEIRYNNWTGLKYNSSKVSWPEDTLADLKTKYDMQEQVITFAPTYPVCKMQDKYSQGDQDELGKYRCLSWADRHLFKGHNLEGEGYEALFEVMGSDHRPVCSDYKWKL